MRTIAEISSDLIKNFIANSEGNVSYVGEKGSARGYIDATAMEINELETELTQAQRDLFVDTCSRTKLETYVSQRGLTPTRLPASNAGVLLLFSGTVGTTITAGTAIKNKLNGLNYILQQDVTLGAKNSNLAISGEINLKSAILGDIGWGVCATAGISGRCPANTCTVIAVSGVTVTNPSPGQGGSDIETDEELRYRYKNENKKANVSTRTFYENIAIAQSNKVLRAIAKKDYSQPDTVRLTVATKSGSPLAQDELDILSALIQENNRAFETVVCENVNFTYISVAFSVVLSGSPVDFDKYKNDTIEALSQYLQWRNWEWGKSVSLDDLFVICQKTPQTRDIPLNSFKINGVGTTEILIPNNSLPYLVDVTITNITNLASAVKSSSSGIVQNYTNIN